jgi:hypothetical protein
MVEGLDCLRPVDPVRRFASILFIIHEKAVISLQFAEAPVFRVHQAMTDSAAPPGMLKCFLIHGGRRQHACPVLAKQVCNRFL